MTRSLLATLAVLLSVAPAVGAQSVEGSLQSLARDNAELYARPVFEGMGNALNAGFLRTPDVHGQLGFDVGIRVVGALIPDDRNTFRAIPPERITVTVGGLGERSYADPYAPRGGSLETPTAVGDGAGVVLEPTGDYRRDLLAAGQNPDDFNVVFPEGFDVPAIPFAVIRAGLGVGFGTEVSLRFMPGIEVNEDVGDVGAFGFAVTHSLDRWFPAPIPVDLAAFGGYQNFTVGDYADAATTTFGVSVGKGLGPLSIYGLGQYESPSTDLEYTVENPGNENPALPDDGTRIAFSPDLEAGTRFGLGLQLDLMILELAAEYSSGDYDAVTGRVSISFR